MQKALQYVEAETHVLEEGTVIECTQSFSLIGEHVCEGKRIIPLDALGGKRIKLEEPKRSVLEDSVERMYGDVGDVKLEMKRIDACHKGEIFSAEWAPVNPNMLASCGSDYTSKIWNIRDLENKKLSLRHKTERGSAKNVFAQNWNFDGSLLATGCSDGACRIWDTATGSLTSTFSQQPLATQNNSNAVFAVKWNKKADYLLSMSVKKVYLWATGSSNVGGNNTWTFNSESQLFDIDWRNNSSFAVAGRNIYICKTGESSKDSSKESFKEPIKTFRGHIDDINVIRWNQGGSHLASCSDDKTIKIWSMKKDNFLSNFDKHQKPVTSIRWRPTPDQSTQTCIASASVDSTIKLWDVDKNICLSSLSKHTGSVDCIEFSPDGEYLLSGSDDNTLNIWSMKDRQLVKSYTKDTFTKHNIASHPNPTGSSSSSNSNNSSNNNNNKKSTNSNNGFISASWNSNGTKIAVFNPATNKESAISILDFRM